MKIIVDAKDVDEFLVRTGQVPGKFKREKSTVLNWLGMRFVAIMRFTLMRERASGTLEESIRVKDRDGNSVTVGPSAPHAIHVRTGGVPHWAPIESCPRPPCIVNWIEIKGITSARYKTSRRLAGAIRWGIKQRGTSQWAARHYQTSGENPFPKRAIESPEAHNVLRQAVVWLNKSIMGLLTEEP